MGGKRLFTEEQEDYLIYYLYCKDEPNYKAAADYLGVTTQQVIDWRRYKNRKKGMNLESIQPDYTEREIRIIKQYYSYKSAAEIGEWIGRSAISVQKKANALKVYKVKGPTRAYDAEIRKLVSEGHYLKNIAKALGLKYESVRSYCEKMTLNINGCHTVKETVGTKTIAIGNN